ncbi:MAG: AMP-binding protein [Actinomycetaceae bacterium]|nr:AMP-binding protein [Actinomycetaceae bacterium]
MRAYTAITEQAHSHYEPGVPFEIPTPDASVFELLEHTARAYPQAIAIDYFGQTWTYSEIYTQALKAAEVLRTAGVKKGDIISLALPNCPQHFIAFYGAMRLGVAVAELNPLAPSAELSRQIARHKGSVAIVWDKVAYKMTEAGLATHDIFTVNLIHDMPLKMRFSLKLPVDKAKKSRRKLTGTTPRGCLSWDRLIDNAPTLASEYAGARGSDTAVILHSSGTNGVPKSVPITHANIRANVNQNLFWVFELDRGSETFYSLLPYFHAFGMTFFLCCAVGIGATQIVLPSFDVDLALEAHLRRRVTFFVGVPPMFDRIARGAIKRGIDITSIKYSICGGMALAPAISSLWEETTGHYIIEGYGMSETSPTVCGSPLSSARRHGCLGLPFPSTELRIVSTEDPRVDVADGETGELLVRGPQVFGGYLDAEEENEKAFVDGWFRTGDICRNDDGFIYLVDRSKDLIICSGFNVFPSQVEDAIKRVASVKDCVVVGLPDAVRGENVVAVVVADWKKPDVDRLRATLERELPHYALPRELILVDEIPHSLIGKPERKKVRDSLIVGRSTELS